MLPIARFLSFYILLVPHRPGASEKFTSEMKSESSDQQGQKGMAVLNLKS